ncbi:hypothetical protein PIB30_027212 [Stylosanthes scabra]|uniref:Uncharacterized protein n=1 Tax=Stylosanthes scabra TaxID=79078 RepID=A0ABU6TAS3_9FABA|nr:hypothetical protein [Stylosanthes scabra]
MTNIDWDNEYSSWFWESEGFGMLAAKVGKPNLNAGEFLLGFVSFIDGASSVENLLHLTRNLQFPTHLGLNLQLPHLRLFSQLSLSPHHCQVPTHPPFSCFVSYQNQ